MYRGYLTSRPFMGERVPQHIQNQIIRNFCLNKNLHYLLSVTEYSIENSTLILNQLFDEIKSIDGVVFYSLFQLPKDTKTRNYFIKKFISKNKTLYFAVEDLMIKNNHDHDRIENIWQLKLNIDFCPASIEYERKNYE